MLGRLLRAPLARAGALLSPRVVAPAAARTLAPPSLPLPLAPPLLGGGQWRSIITVNVYSPSRRGDFTSPQAYQAEVMKSEEIALNRFNRLLRNEVERGTIPKGGRPQKRWSRFVKPYKRRLLAKVYLPHSGDHDEAGQDHRHEHHVDRRGRNRRGNTQEDDAQYLDQEHDEVRGGALGDRVRELCGELQA